MTTLMVIIAWLAATPVVGSLLAGVVRRADQALSDAADTCGPTATGSPRSAVPWSQVIGDAPDAARPGTSRPRVGAPL